MKFHVCKGIIYFVKLKQNIKTKHLGKQVYCCNPIGNMAWFIPHENNLTLYEFIGALCSEILTFYILMPCRYYYDGDMISKVQGKRFVYKFVCDLRTLIGYSAAELNNLVTECEQKKLARMQMHGIGQPITTVTLATTTLDKDSWRIPHYSAFQLSRADSTLHPWLEIKSTFFFFLTQLCSSSTEMQGWSLISVDKQLCYCLYWLIQVRQRQDKTFFF